MQELQTLSVKPPALHAATLPTAPLMEDRELHVRRDVHWLPAGSVLRCIASSTLPPSHLTSCALGFCFQGTKLLLVNDEERGWDLPGGHIEKGEEIQRALHRELYEEGYVRALDARAFARFEIEVPSPKPEGYHYPFPKSFIACFIATDLSVLPFQREFETLERKFFAPEEVRTLPWYHRNSAMYEEALRVASATSPRSSFAET